jgi:hypothetical protein
MQSFQRGVSHLLAAVRTKGGQPHAMDTRIHKDGPPSKYKRTFCARFFVKFSLLNVVGLLFLNLYFM